MLTVSSLWDSTAKLKVSTDRRFTSIHYRWLSQRERWMQPVILLLQVRPHQYMPRRKGMEGQMGRQAGKQKKTSNSITPMTKGLTSRPNASSHMLTYYSEKNIQRIHNCQINSNRCHQNLFSSQCFSTKVFWRQQCWVKLCKKSLESLMHKRINVLAVKVIGS